MPDPRDDLIRRGDVLDVIVSGSWSQDDASLQIRHLPADPAVAAALALAEKIHPHIVDISEDGPLYGCCACSREWRDVESHEPHCALAAYRTEERERAARIAEDREAPVISDAIRRRQEG